MRAIQCLNCRTYTPGDRAECLYCGAALNSVAPPAVEIQDSASDRKKEFSMPLECPVCHSQNVQQLSMVHISGVSTGTGVGIGVAGGIVGGGIGTSKNQTALSKSAAPPTMQTGQKGGLIAIGVLALVISFVVLISTGANGLFWIFLVGGVASIALSQTAFISNWDKNANALRQQWSKSFMCHACGHRFVP